MTEREKYLAGKPYDVNKMFAEMDDSALDAVIEGVKESNPPKTKEKLGEYYPDKDEEV